MQHFSILVAALFAHVSIAQLVTVVTPSISYTTIVVPEPTELSYNGEVYIVTTATTLTVPCTTSVTSEIKTAAPSPINTITVTSLRTVTATICTSPSINMPEETPVMMGTGMMMPTPVPAAITPMAVYTGAAARTGGSALAVVVIAVVALFFGA